MLLSNTFRIESQEEKLTLNSIDNINKKKLQGRMKQRRFVGGILRLRYFIIPKYDVHKHVVYKFKVLLTCIKGIESWILISASGSITTILSQDYFQQNDCPVHGF